MVLRNAVLLLVLKSSQIPSRNNKCKQRAAVITVTYLLILNLIPLITPFLQSSTGARHTVDNNFLENQTVLILYYFSCTYIAPYNYTNMAL